MSKDKKLEAIKAWAEENDRKFLEGQEVEGISHDEYLIHNPFLSVCGRFEVNPFEYYPSFKEFYDNFQI